MKKNTLIAISMGAIVAFSTPLLIAKENNADHMQMSKLLDTLNAKGITVVKKIELDGDKFEASVINAQGKEMKVKLNAKTGELEKQKENLQGLTALEIAKKLEGEGYHNIYKINAEGSKFEVKAFDNAGKKIELKIDAKTGTILNGKK